MLQANSSFRRMVKYNGQSNFLFLSQSLLSTVNNVEDKLHPRPARKENLSGDKFKYKCIYVNI